MQLSQLNILVVGAATGGSAIALLLARSGARVTVVDRVAKHSPIGAGLALAANGRAVLEGLGLGPALATQNDSPALRITNGCGRTLALPPKGARFSVVARSRLREVLTDALMGEPRITCRFGTQLMRANRDGTVVLLRDSVETIEHFDLVIGADGVHSRVREGGNFGARVRRTGTRYLRALVPFKVKEGAEAWTPSGIFGSAPLNEGTYIFASCVAPAVKRAIDQRDLTALHSAWSAVYERASWLLMGVASFDDLLIHEMILVYCKRWHDGKLVLLGDAAHAMAPNLGQGANSALVDAAILADALRTSNDLCAALTAYNARRHHKVSAVAKTAERIGRLAELGSPFARRLRDGLLMPLIGVLPANRQLRALLQEEPETLLRIGRALPVQ